MPEIRDFDCGILPNPSYPRQENVAASKPLLADVVHAVSQACQESGRQIPHFNIELKSNPDWYDVFIPPPNRFVTIVISEIKSLGLKKNVTLQSFDLAMLQEIHRQASSIPISLLIQNTKDPQSNIKELGFIPDVYSPYYKLVNAKMLSQLHARNIRVIPWTVNDVEEMRALIDMGVDGIITDYPDLITEAQKVP